MIKQENIIISTILNMSHAKGLKIHKLNNGNIRCFEIPRNLIKSSKEELILIILEFIF